SSSSDSDDRGGGGVSSWLAPWSPGERRVLGTSAIFTLQAVEKLALAEGSRLVLAALQSPAQQGVYGLVANLGSLVVRTLFQPLEEAAFAAFSTWGGGGGGGGAGGGTEDGVTAATGAEIAGEGTAAVTEEKREKERRRLAALAGALGPMVKVVSLLGLAAAAFGPSYAYVALRGVYGTRWSESEAPGVLAAYSVYVLLLALNGIGEAFVHAVLDARGLQQSNMLLLVFSGAHLAACVVLVQQYGALGLVAADSVNMLLRIAYSAWCIRRFFRPLPSFSLQRDLLPAPPTLAAFAAAAAVAAASNRLIMRLPWAASDPWVMPQRVFLQRAAAHVGVGVLLLGALAGLMARTERSTLRLALELRRKGRGKGDGGKGGAVAGSERVKED
ncbi:hypothetical protein Agub_g10647, partial [Astrephomene gubernaculifera]